MRKFLNRIVPAFALSAIVTATAAYAAAAPVEQKLPESWQKPANVIIYDMSDYDMSYSYNFTLKVSYDKGDDLLDFLSVPDAQRASDYGLSSGKLKATAAQIDWSIDEQDNWIYDEFKDKWDTVSSKNSPVWDYSGVQGDENAVLTADKTQSRNILNLYSTSEKQWSQSGLADRVSPYTYELENAFAIKVPMINLKHHTVYVRIRFAVKLADDRVIFSDWSDVAAIGKDGIENGSKDEKTDEKIDVTWLGVSDWAADTVERAAVKGIYPKVLDKENLTRSINRREFAALACSLMSKLGFDNTETPHDNPFIDTKDANVLKAYSMGIIYGKSDNEFCPMEPITREEAAVILHRVCRKIFQSGAVIDKSIDFGEKYADDGQISAWAKEAVYFMSSSKIMEGVGSGCFAPHDNTSAEQAIAIAMRIYELKN